MKTLIVIGVLLLILIWLVLHDLKNTHFNGRYDIGETPVNKFIYWKDFEKNWVYAKVGNKSADGYKVMEDSGVYVILIKNHYSYLGSFRTYRDVYVGQSLTLYQRVHDHFNGHGNGDVYADCKYNKRVYVKLIPCSPDEMNSLEIKLIKFYDATKSYNVTKGGSTIR